MVSSKEKQRFVALEEWFLSQPGQYVIQHFFEEIKRLNDWLAGDVILQLGSCGHQKISDSLNYKASWIASVVPTVHANLIASFEELPFDRNSVDCMVLPFINEIYSYQQAIYDEMDRVLKPNGHVIFFGINPLSFWGFWLNFSRNNCFKSNRVKLHSIYYLKKIMNHLGYKQRYYSNFYYLPPLKNIEQIKSFQVVDKLGKFIAPWPANLFCLIAKKCCFELIHHHQRTTTQPRLSLNLISPSFCCSQFNYTCGKISNF